MEEKTYYCPEHNAALIQKKILYGYPDPSGDYSKVILGGCCVSNDSPKYGFECPVDQEAFIMKNGKLNSLRED